MKKILILLALGSLIMGGAAQSLSSVNPFVEGHGITVAAAVYKEQKNRKQAQEGDASPLPMNLREQQLRKMGELLKAKPVKVNITQIQDKPAIADKTKSSNGKLNLKTKQKSKAVETKGKSGSGFANLSPGDSSEPTDMIKGDSNGALP